MIQKFNDAVKTVYGELDNCIILGLTGRTGSGCTTTSKILETKRFQDLTLPTPKSYDYKDVEERKYQIVYRFIKNNWSPFTTIEVSSIILSFVLEKNKDEFIKFIENLTVEGDLYNFHIGGKKDLLSRLNSFEHIFGKKLNKINDDIMSLDDREIEEYYNYFIKTIKNFKKAFYNVLSEFSCYENKKAIFIN